MKGLVRGSVWASEFNMKHPKKAKRHIDLNVVSIMIK